MKPNAPKTMILVLSLVCLGHLYGPEGARRIACVEERKEISALDFNAFPIQQDLFANVQNAELKRSAQANYAWLSQIELESMMIQQRARSAYGLSGPLFSAPAPITIANFNPQTPNSYVANGNTWGAFTADPTLNRYFPGVNGTLASSMLVPQLTGQPGLSRPLVQGNMPFLVRNRF